MKIGLYTDSLRSGRHTGIGEYVRGTVAGLSEVLHSDSLRLVVPRERIPHPTQLPVHICPTPWPRKLLLGSWVLWNHPRLETLVGSDDVLHILVPGVYVPTKSKVVLTIHDLFPFKYPEWFSRRARYYFRRDLELAVEKGRHLVAVSVATGRDLETLLGVPKELISVVYPGIPIGTCGAAVTAESFAGGEHPYFLFVGALTPRKNPLGLIKAFHKVQAEQRTKVRLKIVGTPGGASAEVSALIDQLSLGEDVDVHVNLSASRLCLLLLGATALILPSFDEGFGFPVLEAMARGVPVIATNRGSLPEVVGTAGVLCEPDAGSLADAMLRVLLGSPNEGMRLAGPKQAGRFSWKSSAESLVRVYSAVS